MCKDRGIRHLLLAHHRSDQVETFFLQLFRGSGANGLSGMNLRNGILVRPLLDIDSSIIQRYAEENKVNWRDDSSNKKSEYTRNFLRNELLPKLRKRVPQLDQVVSETCTRLQSEQNLLRAFIDRLGILSKNADGQLVISLKKIIDFPEKERILHQVLAETEIPFALCREICANLTSTEELSFHYRGYTANLKSGKITVYQLNSPQNTDSKKSKPRLHCEIVPLSTDCIDIREENVVLLSDQINPNDLHLRTWRNGDYFYPSGMSGKKKISDFWNDLKLDQQAKNSQWLLCCNDAIVWVVNRRKDKRFEANRTNKTALKIQIIFDH
jgi:tRNA(Ile)-lysidine synthase